MNSRRQALLIGDQRKQPGKLIALFFLECREKGIVVLPGDEANFAEGVFAFPGEMEGVDAAVVRILATLHQAERLKLIHDRNEAARMDVQDQRELLLIEAGGAA